MRINLHTILVDIVSSADRAAIDNTLERVADGTNTDDLVVALYLMKGRHQARGIYLRAWITPEEFHATRGKWTFTQKWPAPDDLPPQSKLIRMRLDPILSYPTRERDRYEWEFQYGGFQDHLATLFAHELHHFRRYHLDLHPHQGEHAANRWALERVQALGFNVEGSRLAIKKKRASARTAFIQHFPKLDPFSAFRNLKTGSKIIITHDPRGRYDGQQAEVLRPIRSNSKRITIQTADGHTWRWPMTWAQSIDE